MLLHTIAFLFLPFSLIVKITRNMPLDCGLGVEVSVFYDFDRQ
jgi:hypothetical protein